MNYGRFQSGVGTLGRVFRPNSTGSISISSLHTSTANTQDIMVLTSPLVDYVRGCGGYFLTEPSFDAASPP